jgi:hypothetical protein
MTTKNYLAGLKKLIENCLDSERFMSFDLVMSQENLDLVLECEQKSNPDSFENYIIGDKISEQEIYNHEIIEDCTISIIEFENYYVESKPTGKTNLTFPPEIMS